MNKTFAKAVINFCGIAFIVAGLAALFLNVKIVVGAIIFILAGVSILRRKPFVVYIIMFVAFVVAAVGLIIAGLAISDILHRNNRLDMLLIGLVPIIFSFLALYFFTRREVAEEFGLEKIEILEKFNKRELIVAGKVLFWIAAIVGVVFLLCYLGVALMTGSGFKP
ncbi:MAG: hypothetical protein PHQ96_03285 [Candidatus Omnitrophica bacterium]|nr:hypothetical protein [Candidatus Omnitrophota bacterium]